MSPHASTSNIMNNTGDDTFPPAFALTLGPFTAQPIQTVNNDFLPTSTYTDEEEQFTAWVLGHAGWDAEQSDVPAAEELPPLDIPAASQVTNSFATIAGYTLRSPLEAYTPVCVDPQQLVLPLQQATPPNPSWALLAAEYYTPPLSHSYDLNQPAHAYEQIPVAAASSRPGKSMVQSQGYVRPNPYQKDWNRRKENGKGKEVVRDIYPAPYPSTGRDPRERITHNNKRSGSSADERNFASFSHNADVQRCVQVPQYVFFAHEMGNTYREQHMGSRTYHQYRPMQPIPVMVLPASASSSSPQPKTKKSRKENNRGTIIQGVREPPSVETLQRRELEAAMKAEKRAAKKAAKKAAAEEQKAETKRIKLEQRKEEFERLAQATEEWESRGGRWVIASIEDAAPSMGVINFGCGK